MGPEYSQLEYKLAYMEQHGIDLSVLSLGNPWVDFMEPVEAAWWASSLNEELESVCAARPQFRALGVLPMQDVAAACAELGRLAALPHIRGAILGTRPGGLHLDDPVLGPFWAEAEARQVPLFVHPHYIVGADWMAGYGHAMFLALGFTFETTAAVTRLILGGVLERHPDLVLILAHGGGTLPYLAGRLDACTQVDGNAQRNLKRPFSEYLKLLYYDALLYQAASVECAQALVGSDRLIFGTDHPFGIADPSACLRAVAAAAASRDAAEQITSGNARRILGLGPL
jgi:predicted TIM-barrel fold metal-dependent hydrolase